MIVRILIDTPTGFYHRVLLCVATIMGINPAWPLTAQAIYWWTAAFFFYIAAIEAFKPTSADLELSKLREDTGLALICLKVQQDITYKETYEALNEAKHHLEQYRQIKALRSNTD